MLFVFSTAFPQVSYTSSQFPAPFATYHAKAVKQYSSFVLVHSGICTSFQVPSRLHVDCLDLKHDVLSIEKKKHCYQELLRKPYLNCVDKSTLLHSEIYPMYQDVHVLTLWPARQ